MAESRTYMLNGTDIQNVIARLEAFYALKKEWKCKALKQRTGILCRQASQRTGGKP